MTSWVCVDSGIVLKLVLDEPDSDRAEALWISWVQSGRQPVAPYLFTFEITAVLRKHVYRGPLTEADGAHALERALAFNVVLLSTDDLHVRAWNLASRFNRPTAYDAHYLALAEGLKCEFWTADQRLYNSVKDELGWVRWISQAPVIDEADALSAMATLGSSGDPTGSIEHDRDIYGE